MHDACVLDFLAKEEELFRATAAKAEEEGRGLERHDPFWPAQATIVAAILLYLYLPEKLTLGPSWLIPACEGLLLVALVIAMPSPAMQYSPRRRYIALGLTAVVSAATLSSLVLLVHYLLKGGKVGGHALILSGIVIWVTNVLVFALWYWELDRGGPVARNLNPEIKPDFLFPQMTAPEWAPDDWHPTFIDYLFVSFTNASAFSPTDTMPLSRWAKRLFMVQSTASLLTIGLVVARAVNILS